MSRTFKDTPTWVRELRADTCREVHVGCPQAAEPRWRRVPFETVAADPCWHLEQHLYRYDFDSHREVRITNTALSWWATKTRTEWVFGPLIETGWQWEPYRVDQCDLTVNGRPSSRQRCHYDWDPGDRTGQRPRKTGRRIQMFDQAERGRVRDTLNAARRDWNTNRDTDLEPLHVPADPWMWD